MAEKRSKKPTDRSTVRAYKHFEELRDCLASGWSAPMVRTYMVERYGEAGVPHEKAIQRWRDKHLDVAAVVLPHQVIRDKLKGVEYKVDAIGHLSRLVAICEERVGRGLDQEQQFGGIPLAFNDTIIGTYIRAITEYVKVAQDLGIMKSPAPSPVLIDARTQYANMTPELLMTLQDTVREIRMIENGQIAAESRKLSIQQSQNMTDGVDGHGD